MKLHVFNPEHDIALASGLTNFTAPHAGRSLRHDLGFLPALWAASDDVVWTDDIGFAQRAYRRVVAQIHNLTAGQSVRLPAATCFVGRQQPFDRSGLSQVDAWGWDGALRAFLLRQGVDAALLPSVDRLADIRGLSHRRQAVALLKCLHIEGCTTGTSVECHSVESVGSLLSSMRSVVLKAPWSSSGRGLRFVTDASPHALDTDGPNPHLAGWLRNVLAMQGSVIVEPYYNKVKDFGMEFYSDGQGTVSYQGASLFQTENGAYVGNILATESSKRQMLARYLPAMLLDEVQKRICDELGPVFRHRYEGPFGVDMMVCASTAGYLLHPCVEINLRRTMGHVALALGRLCNPADDGEFCRVMRIIYNEGNYQLKIQRL